MSKKNFGFLASYCKTSVMRKHIMALTGLALCGFLTTHLLGNLLLVLSPEAFNNYAHKLITNPLIYGAEAVLVVIFLSHIIMGIRLVIQNKRARPVKYYAKKGKGGETFASKTMPITGMIILIFLVTHIMHFKYGSVYMVEYAHGESVRDIYRTVIEYFDSLIYTIWYVFAMAALGLHLSHGFQSAFQSLGFHHKKYTACIKKAGLAFAIIVPGGFAALAVWCHFQ